MTSSRLVKAAYNIELTPGEFKAESEGHGNRMNDYKYKSLDVTTKQVEVYVYTESNGVHEVALIFEYPKSKENAHGPKIRHCLESFAVGERAEALV